MNDKGYTLIEFIVVVSIITIMSSIAFIGIQKGFKLDGATRMIFSDLHNTRIKAIRYKHDFRVVFDSNGHTYNINNIDTGQTLLTRDIHENYQGVFFETAINPTFDPFGIITDAGNIKIKKGSNVKYVKIFWTGRIRIL
ncbi:MAG: GspH/FimT family pseudopilin [bacterium]